MTLIFLSIFLLTSVLSYNFTDASVNTAGNFEIKNLGGLAIAQFLMSLTIFVTR